MYDQFGITWDIVGITWVIGKAFVAKEVRVEVFGMNFWRPLFAQSKRQASGRLLSLPLNISTSMRTMVTPAMRFGVSERALTDAGSGSS